MRLFLWMLAACTGPDTGPADDTGTSDDTGAAEVGCRAGAPSPDTTRFVALSHPYGPSAVQSDAWEVLALAVDGTLSRPGHTFALGRSTAGPVRFTDDGSLGVAVLDDGSLGVFTLAADGTPTIVQTGFADDGAGGAFYASDVRIDPSGEHAWVVDGNWANNGGGIYGVDLDCTTGEPSGTGLVGPSKLARHLLPLPDGTHLLVGQDAFGASGDLHHVDLSGPTVLASVDLWPDDEAIVGGATLGGDGAYVLVGDNSGFSSVPNRVAVAKVDGLTTVQIVTPLEDPVALAAWGSATVVASGFGDALYALDFDADTTTPFSNAGTLSTSTGVEIPGDVVAVAGPDGDGFLLVPEVTAVRVLRATPSGAVTEQSVLDLGDGYVAIAGALGVQP